MSNRIKSDEIQIGNSYVLPIEQSNVTRQQAKVKKIIEETDAMAQKIIDGVNTGNYAVERKIHEIDDSLRCLLRNIARIAEFLDKQEKIEPESNQYKRINKQLDKLIALMSENE